MKRRIISFLLALCLVIGLIPASAPQAEAAGFDTTGWVWPVKAVNAPAGASNRNLYCKTMYRAYYNTHQAIDITDYTGYNYAIRAAKSGTVRTVYSGCKNYSGASTGASCKSAGCTPNAGYWTYEGTAFCNNGFGNGVVINHDNGVDSSEYAHMASVTVSPGQYVQAGQIIGYMGSAGASTGKHLDFVIKHNGTRVNNNPIGDVLLYNTSLWNGVDTIAYLDEPNYHTHSYTAKVTAATCQQQGYTTYTCSCGDQYVADYTTGTHAWSFSGTTPATCKAPASDNYTCATCGESKSEDGELTWSEWSATVPDEAEPDRIEQQTQYRYRDRESNWKQTESGTVYYVASWPSGFSKTHSFYSQYNNTPVKDTQTENSKITVTSTQHAGYIYYHWCRGTYTAGPINRLVSDIPEGDMVAFHAFTSSQNAGHSDGSTTVSDVYYLPNAGCCADSYWFFRVDITRQDYTVSQLQFTGERWGEWSEWSGDVITATENRQVETRTVYRCITGGLADHNWQADADGITRVCSICGEISDLTDGSPFCDVFNTDWYFAPVKWAVKNKITAGTSETTFSPNDPCTRGQVVTFLYRAAGSPAVSGNSPFSDVKTSDYFHDAVLWAVSNGITQGTGGGKFSPDEPCTRAQVVTFLWRSAGSPNAGTIARFLDVPVNEYYYKSAHWAVENGITVGTAAGIFSPDESCTRAQIVTFLYRAENS